MRPEVRLEPSAPAPTDATPTAIGGAFAELGLAPELCLVLATLGYEEPTPIQRAAIPPLLAGRDVLGRAATGTGKTAAFALPLLQTIAGPRPEPGRPRALVLVPTRELSMQVAAAIERYGRGRGATVLAVFGGQSVWQQVRVLDRGVETVVATPGRAMDHLERGTLSLDALSLVVLDEADEMLDMGFADDIEAILARAPVPRRTALFSATMPPRIRALAERHLVDPLRVEIERESAAPGEVPRVRQVAHVVPRALKLAALGRVLEVESPASAIVFCRTRLEVDDVTEALNARGRRAEALHGGLPQEHRDRVMARFRENRSNVLVATDVAARGLDIDHVSHVVNLDVPTEPESYVHRIGRTGRAGREGVAITFVEPREQRLFGNVEHAIGQPIPVLPVPTSAELRARRLATTRAELEAARAPEGLAPFRALAEELAAGGDALDVAATAIRLLHESRRPAQGPDDEVEFPAPPRAGEPRGKRDTRSRGDRRGKFAAGRDVGREPARGPAPDEARGPGRAPRPRREGPANRPSDRGHADARHEPARERLQVSAGRFQSIRAGDIVGAITGETGLPSAVVGAIQIADRSSFVDVAAEHAEHVAEALRRTKIRGRRVQVRVVSDPR